MQGKQPGILVADLGSRHGGTMRIRRAIIIPAILALGVTGSVVAGSAMSAAAGQASSTHIHVVAGAHFHN